MAMLAMAEVIRAVSLVVKWAMAPAKTKTRMGMACMPETSSAHRFDPVSSYITQDWAAVRATAPMSKRAWEARRHAKPEISKTRRTWGGRGRAGRAVGSVADIASLPVMGCVRKNA